MSNLIEYIQTELDEATKLIKADLVDKTLAKSRPDLYQALVHVLDRREFMERSSVSQHKDEFLYLSLERFQ